MIQFPTAERKLARLEKRVAKADLKGLKKIEDQLLIATDAKVQKFVEKILAQIGERRRMFLDAEPEVTESDHTPFGIVHELDRKSLASNFRSRVEAIRDRLLKGHTLDPLRALNRTQRFEITRYAGG